MSEKMLFSENERAGIFGVSLLLIELIFIIGNVLGIVSLFHNSTLTKKPFGIFLFGLPNFILFVTLLFMVWGFWVCISDSGDGRNFQRGRKIFKNGIVASFLLGTLILLIDVIFLKVPFGIHLLFSYCFLLLLLFGTQVYRARSGIPEEDTKARFIAFLKNIVPIQFQEEWLGDLQGHYYRLIKDSTPLWKVYWITLFTDLGLIGLIRSYLWLKADKFISRWMIRAKKVFLG